MHTGEAAGIAIGLVKLGTCDLAAITDMLTYARESQHEKILRGLAVGLALTLYGRLEEADHCISELSRDKDPILRWAAALAIGAAYAGTANNSAVRQLLHMAVSDVADDVRRTAVAAIGYILFRSPEQCPTVVSLLAESYNPHVRSEIRPVSGCICPAWGRGIPSAPFLCPFSSSSFVFFSLALPIFFFCSYLPFLPESSKLLSILRNKREPV